MPLKRAMKLTHKEASLYAAHMRMKDDEEFERWGYLIAAVKNFSSGKYAPLRFEKAEDVFPRLKRHKPPAKKMSAEEMEKRLAHWGGRKAKKGK